MARWVSPGIRAGVTRDLARMPDELAGGGMARSALLLGRMLDSGDLDPREIVAAQRALCVTMTVLAEMAPARAEGSIVDELRARRAQRAAATG